MDEIKQVDEETDLLGVYLRSQFFSYVMKNPSWGANAIGLPFLNYIGLAGFLTNYVCMNVAIMAVEQLSNSILRIDIKHMTLAYGS